MKSNRHTGEFPVEWDDVSLRLDQIERAIDRIAAAVPVPETPATPAARQDFVTHDELSSTLKTLELRIEENLDAKFELQTISIGALKAMVSQTDSLLERVLVALEAKEDQELLGEPVRTSSE